MSLATSANGGTFRTPREVRLESVMCTQTDIREHLSRQAFARKHPKTVTIVAKA